MAAPSIKVSETPLVLCTLRRADDALISGHRLSEWCGHAPILEEDMALTNMSLDLIGQARALLTHVGQSAPQKLDEDQLAFLREERDGIVLVTFRVVLPTFPLRLQRREQSPRIALGTCRTREDGSQEGLLGLVNSPSGLVLA